MHKSYKLCGKMPGRYLSANASATHQLYQLNYSFNLYFHLHQPLSRPLLHTFSLEYEWSQDRKVYLLSLITRM